jgi:site-specific DNA-methyltransferase (adenine-specific)/modification methylase
LPDAKKWLVWEKRGSTPPDHNSDCELAWTNLKGVLRMFRHTWRGMIRDGRHNIANESLQHPTQKPVELMAWCLDQVMPVKSVDDPFMGSGTLGIACAEAGVRYTGIEIEPHYFDIACERITNAYRQSRMFA